MSDLDPILLSPYGPAACEEPQDRPNTRQNPITLPNQNPRTACIHRGVHTRLVIDRGCRLHTFVSRRVLLTMPSRLLDVHGRRLSGPEIAVIGFRWERAYHTTLGAIAPRYAHALHDPPVADPDMQGRFLPALPWSGKGGPPLDRSTRALTPVRSEHHCAAAGADRLAGHQRAAGAGKEEDRGFNGDYERRVVAITTSRCDRR